MNKNDEFSKRELIEYIDEISYAFCEKHYDKEKCSCSKCPLWIENNQVDIDCRVTYIEMLLKSYKGD